MNSKVFIRKSNKHFWRWHFCLFVLFSFAQILFFNPSFLPSPRTSENCYYNKPILCSKIIFLITLCKMHLCSVLFFFPTKNEEQENVFCGRLFYHSFFFFLIFKWDSTFHPCFTSWNPKIWKGALVYGDVFFFFSRYFGVGISLFFLTSLNSFILTFFFVCWNFDGWKSLRVCWLLPFFLGGIFYKKKACMILLYVCFEKNGSSFIQNIKAFPNWNLISKVNNIYNSVKNFFFFNYTISIFITAIGSFFFIFREQSRL